MTREESKMMQGVAILIMIFFHLFNTHVTNEYQGTIIGNLAMANNPVPFYVFLSGYGLYCVYQTRKDKNKYKRCFRLYLHYWIITAIFIIISLILQTREYDFSFTNITKNVVGISTDYYASAWFILPYIILSIGSSIIFKFIDKCNIGFTLIASYLLYLMAAYMNQYEFFSSNVCQVFYIQFSFILGAIIAKYGVISRLRERTKTLPSYLLIVLLALLIVIRYFIHTGAVITFYATAFICLAVIMKKAKWIERCLLSLGKASLNMWMIHTWIFSYLFSKEIYGIGNPILIFTIVTAVSFLLSKLFDVVLHPITRTLLR